ncbi:hypothetical protein CXG81DRAFT_20651 [Caulochytrium protostelioides]|uniref:Uncharacterized protein n=1 Tax=Caulochytrium protostelioides TaxID=1555241 RepID=A0A4V1IU42_9FUNG|nr:hypothetical protein CXG81DRAFT_20651 [Caulochytrium protostelioides]|eukprot:RKO99247.1 hypothetical protein CXG81DRAFT_20651 [Caulochytrium protostelioides]
MADVAWSFDPGRRPMATAPPPPPPLPHKRSQRRTAGQPSPSAQRGSVAQNKGAMMTHAAHPIAAAIAVAAENAPARIESPAGGPVTSQAPVRPRVPASSHHRRHVCRDGRPDRTASLIESQQIRSACQGLLQCPRVRSTRDGITARGERDTNRRPAIAAVMEGGPRGLPLYWDHGDGGGGGGDGGGALACHDHGLPSPALVMRTGNDRRIDLDWSAAGAAPQTPATSPPMGPRSVSPHAVVVARRRPPRGSNADVV